MLLRSLFNILLSMGIFEPIPDTIPMIDGSHYLVLYGGVSCGPCNALYQDVFSGEVRKDVNSMYTAVLCLDNNGKNKLNGVKKEKEPTIPTMVVYKYSNGNMTPVSRWVGYSRENKEDVLKFLRKWKNEKSQMDRIKELPGIVTGIFGEQD